MQMGVKKPRWMSEKGGSGKTNITVSSGMEDRKGGDEQEEEEKKWMLG